MPYQSLYTSNLLFDPTSGSTARPYLEPVTVKTSSSIYPYLVTIFADTTTRLSIYTAFRVPNNYSSGASVILFWDSTSSSSGGVLWEFDYLARSSGQFLGSTSLDQSTGVIGQAASSQAAGLVISTISLTATNFTANELVQCSLHRTGSSTGSDNLAAAVRLHGAYFDYTT